MLRTRDVLQILTNGKFFEEPKVRHTNEHNKLTIRMNEHSNKNDEMNKKCEKDKMFLLKQINKKAKSTKRR